MNKGGTYASMLAARRLRKGRPEHARGFTIAETLVVLAVTGLLFASAAVLIAGRQNETQFEQAIHEIETQVQQVISEVSSGFYQNQNDFSCSASGGTLTIGPGGSAQGTNSGCIFLGKAIQFKVPGSPNNPEEFRIYSIAGLQKDSTGQEVQDLTHAQPTVIAPTTGASIPVDESSKVFLQNGLSVLNNSGTTNGMTYTSASGVTRQIGSVAFLNSLASYSGGAIVSGSHQVGLVPVDDGTGVTPSQLNQTPADAARAIDKNLPGSPLDAKSVQICFVSANTNQSGLLTIGGNGRQLAVTLNIRSNKTCA